MSIAIERLLAQSTGLAEDVVLSKVLGNRIDTGNSDGGLISVKQFQALISDIKAWRAWADQQGRTT